MFYAGDDLCCQQIAAGGLKEFHDGLVFKRWRVGKINHDIRVAQGLFQSFTCNGIDARGRRSSNDLMPGLANFGNYFASDEACASNNDDLHN